MLANTSKVDLTAKTNKKICIKCNESFQKVEELGWMDNVCLSSLLTLLIFWQLVLSLTWKGVKEGVLRLAEQFYGNRLHGISIYVFGWKVEQGQIAFPSVPNSLTRYAKSYSFCRTVLAQPNLQKDWYISHLHVQFHHPGCALNKWPKEETNAPRSWWTCNNRTLVYPASLAIYLVTFHKLALWPLHMGLMKLHKHTSHINLL